MQTGKKMGMQVLNDEILKLVKSDTITAVEGWKNHQTKKDCY